MSIDRYVDQTFLLLGIIYLTSAFYILYRFFVQRQIWKLYTILYLTSYSFILVFCFFYFSNLPGADTGALLFNMPALFILTASAYLATRIIVYPDYSYSLRNLVHFIPSLTISIYLFYLCRAQTGDKTPALAVEHLNIILSDKYLNYFALLSLLDILFYLSFQIFEIAWILKEPPGSNVIILKPSQIHKKELLKNKIYKNTVVQLLVIRGLNLGLPVMIYIEIVYGFSLQVIKLTGIFLALNSIMLTFFMAIYSLVFKVPRLAVDKTSVFQMEQHIVESEWRKKIQTVMKNEKPFLDENFQLETLSKLLGIKKNQTSAIISRCFGCTFLDLLHEFRITEVKRILESENDIRPSLTGFDVGYKSMSVYYNAFHKKTGMSPQEYWKKIWQKNS